MNTLASPKGRDRLSQRSVWIDASQLPDSDSTVLIACADGSEPVWLGYHNGEEWLTVEGSFVTVTHWMNLPSAPSV